ncbi:MAG: glycosyltransferase family 2 protein [Deltaproteobacteria bacterium]|nr:glycosyltransferase family 2 protein [Deltaproteobacteria bacterium]
MSNDQQNSEAREKVSAFIIAKNEDDQIADCIASLKFCDEVLVIDSFSDDKTVEIAKQSGAQVYVHKWEGYKEQKAYALSLLKYDWTVNLDADERVSNELRENILHVLRTEYENKKNPQAGTEEIIGYFINRVVYYLGRWWRKGGWYPEYRLRFFRKSKVVWGGINPHEKPIPQGKTERIEGEILHYTYDDMNDQLRRLVNYSLISAKEEFSRDKKVTVVKLLLSPFIRAFKFYVTKKGYREGMAGLIVAILEGYYTFIKYAQVWECELNSKQQGKHGEGS